MTARPRPDANAPFFILGPPRSGTTLLRDVLRSHAAMTCPEETFYARWSFPVGTEEFARSYRDNPTIRHHREIDGLDEREFARALTTARSRRELFDYHGERMLRARGKRRWFDKTPQNVYGVLLLRGYYPEATFVHIHRHPVNVVASLLEGKQISGHTLTGCINYWVEAVLILDQFRRLDPDALFELSYERLAARPEPELRRLLGWLGEPYEELTYDLGRIRPERNRYVELLTDAQADEVMARTRGLRERLGYVELPARSPTAAA